MSANQIEAVLICPRRTDRNRAGKINQLPVPGFHQYRLQLAHAGFSGAGIRNASDRAGYCLVHKAAVLTDIKISVQIINSVLEVRRVRAVIRAGFRSSFGFVVRAVRHCGFHYFGVVPGSFQNVREKTNLGLPGNCFCIRNTIQIAVDHLHHFSTSDLIQGTEGIIPVTGHPALCPGVIDRIFCPVTVSHV